MTEPIGEVAFYHLTRSTLEQTLPQLLQKTIDAEKRAVVIAESTERVGVIDAALWAHDPASWLPHGTSTDGQPESQPESQPVWITDKDENPNGADFLFLIDGAPSNSVDKYERCFEIFNGNDVAVLDGVREKWKLYKDSGFNLTYWQQTDSGGWKKKEV